MELGDTAVGVVIVPFSDTPGEDDGKDGGVGFIVGVVTISDGVVGELGGGAGVAVVLKDRVGVITTGGVVGFETSVGEGVITGGVVGVGSTTGVSTGVLGASVGVGNTSVGVNTSVGDGNIPPGSDDKMLERIPPRPMLLLGAAGGDSGAGVTTGVAAPVEAGPVTPGGVTASGVESGLGIGGRMAEIIDGRGLVPALVDAAAAGVDGEAG